MAAPIGNQNAKGMKPNSTSFKKGQRASIKTEFKKGAIPWNKGKRHDAIRGGKNPNWKGGRKTERQRLMEQVEYKLWRSSVFVRDDYTCQMCLVKGGKLTADHIKPWALYPELRYAIDNGRTLCESCHRQTDTWGFKPMYRKVGA
jgi:hypothetical protein